MRMPIPDNCYNDAEVVWSEHFPNEGVGVWVATNLYEDPDCTEIDTVPIRIRVTTEDGTGSAYLTAIEAYELVQLLGNAITKAKTVERGGNPDAVA